MSIFSKSLRASGISLDDQVGFLYTGSDPTTGSGFEAPVGSILIWKYNPPKIYIKYGSGNTNWTLINSYFAEETISVKYASATTATVSCTNVRVEDQVIPSVSGTITMPTSLDTGSEAASTWYALWIFYKPIDNTYVMKLSASFTNPTLSDSTYTKKRLLSCIRNNSSSNFMMFVHDNDLYRITEATTEIYNANPPTTPATIDLSAFVNSTLLDGEVKLNVRTGRYGVYIYGQALDNTYYRDSISYNEANNNKIETILLKTMKPSMQVADYSTTSSCIISILSWKIKKC